MKIKTRMIAAGAAVTLLIAGGLTVGTVAMAGEPDDQPAAEQQSKRDEFLERVATRLGIDVATLTDAIRGARLDAVNEAEANGNITAQQAAKARERIESGEGIGLREFRKHKQERRAKLARHTIVESSATAIGVTGDELKAELKAGKSIAEVAEANGVSIDAVKSQIVSDAEAKLDQAVANGRIARERADAALSALESRLDEALAKKRAVEPAAP